MLTLKQIEAVYWISKLGSFHAAAKRLNATQSTISKRIAELEKYLAIEIFDRTGKATQLTIKGRELIDDFVQMLDLQQNVVRRVGSDASYAGRFRLGVTEMVALTWLPALIAEIKNQYPDIILEPKIDLTVNLWQQMATHRLDLVIGPTPHAETAFPVLPLGFLESEWMCSPLLFKERKGVVSIQKLLELPLLTYAEGSLLHLNMLKALASIGVKPQNTITCNSMIALAEMASAGLGVTFLPSAYFSSYRAQGYLTPIKTSLALPPLEYVALHRNDAISRRVAELARETCDFGPPRWRGSGRPPRRRA
ncbi:MAG: LysR family transcriptional regulator [Rhizobiales bacterium]|nr:LysR family transcriptional regulator [Hyphomicrobiales bacterium]